MLESTTPDYSTQNTPPPFFKSLYDGWKKLCIIHLQLCQCWELVSTFRPPADHKRPLIRHLAPTSAGLGFFSCTCSIFYSGLLCIFSLW